MEPGRTWLRWNSYVVSERGGRVDKTRLMERANAFYDEACWYPVADKILCAAFGVDIGKIVMYYCQSIQLTVSEP